jgi:hypothetical protein
MVSEFLHYRPEYECVLYHQPSVTCTVLARAAFLAGGSSSKSSPSKLLKMPNFNNVIISEKTGTCTPTEDTKFDRTSLCDKRCCYLWRKFSVNMDIAVSIQCYFPQACFTVTSINF